jgi:hypothetical protein
MVESTPSKSNPSNPMVESNDNQTERQPIEHHGENNPKQSMVETINTLKT